MEKHPDTGAAVAGETPTQVIRRSIRNERNLSCITGYTYLKGNDSQTRFFGQTHLMNMYSQVPFPLSRHTFEESTHSNSLKDFVHISKRSNQKILHSSTCAQSLRFSNVVARRALSPFTSIALSQPTASCTYPRFEGNMPNVGEVRRLRRPDL